MNNLPIGVSQLFSLQALRKSSSLLTRQTMIWWLPMMRLMIMISCDCYIPLRNGILHLKH